MIRLDKLHEAGLDGSGVRIAVLDSGFHYTHPVFAGTSIVDQYDFVDSGKISLLQIDKCLKKHLNVFKTESNIVR